MWHNVCAPFFLHTMCIYVYSCTLQSFVFFVVLNMFYSPLIVIDDSKENVLSYTYCDNIM